MAQALAMQKLGEVLDSQSYMWLASQHPEVLEAIETEVSAGRSAHDVKLFVILRTGRIELALRCEAAARHIKAREAGR